MIGRRDFFCSGPLCFFPCSRLFSYVLRLSLCLISFLLFPFVSVWEKIVHEFPCNIYIPNGTFLFSRGETVGNLGRSFVYENQTKPNETNLIIAVCKFSCASVGYTTPAWVSYFLLPLHLSSAMVEPLKSIFLLIWSNAEPKSEPRCAGAYQSVGAYQLPCVLSWRARAH